MEFLIAGGGGACSAGAAAGAGAGAIAVELVEPLEALFWPVPSQPATVKTISIRKTAKKPLRMRIPFIAGETAEKNMFPARRKKR